MSNQQRIQRLSFTSFRGASQPIEFTFKDEPIILIFGENGTGKSTIADAVDFICNREFGPVKIRKNAKPQHIVSTQGDARDLSVELEVGGKQWQARLEKNKPVVAPADTNPQDPNPPRAFVLRRADITRVMESTDGQRYAALKAYITVPNIEKAEDSLRKAQRAVSKEVQNDIERKQTADDTLQDIWRAEGSPNQDFLTWARTAVQDPVESLQEQKARDETLIAAIKTTTTTFAQKQAAAKTLQQTRTEYAEINEQLTQASQNQSNADLLQTLQAARTYLQKHPEADSCPVCAKPESSATLLNQLDMQLSQLTHIQELDRQLERIKNRGKEANGAERAAREAWQAAYASLHQTLQSAPAELLGGQNAPPITAVEKSSDDPDQDDPRVATFMQQIAARQSWLQGRIETAERTIHQHSLLQQHLETIDELTDLMQQRQQLLDRLSAMLDIVEHERKTHVQNTVDAISDTVRDLYARIHPDEPLGNPNFGLNPKTRASLTITSTFGANTDIPPTAYYSEAHLDTLGLCVYLAFAKHARRALVVLDDILTSVDDPHLERIIQVINDEAEELGHVLITTHSRAWFNRMKYGQSGMQAELIELYGWQLDRGIKHQNAPLAVDELQAAVHAEKLDRQAVASRSGVLLEQLMDHLALTYKFKVPRLHQPRYTLGDLDSAISKKHRKVLKTEIVSTDGTLQTTQELQPLLDSCTNDTWIRNQVGAHFNIDESTIADDSVKQFGESVLSLANAMLCPTCRQLPNRSAGSYWECRCKGVNGKIRLYPLQTK